MTVKRLLSAIAHASFPAYSYQHLFGFEFTSNPLKLIAWFLFRFTVFPQCYPCEVYQVKSLLNLAKCSTSKQHYVRGWKIRWNSQVHCCFVVTPWLQAAWVPTITWYKYLYLVKICLIVPSHRWKRGDHKPKSHVRFCDHTLITIIYDYWGKQNMKEVWVIFNL